MYDDDFDDEDHHERDLQTSCFNGFFRSKQQSRHTKTNSRSHAPTPQEPHRHFGVDLATLYKSEDLRAQTEDGHVPLVAFLCVQYLRTVFNLEGLFRVSGTWGEINTLKASFEKGIIPNLSTCENPHSISGLLDLFLRELPEPLLTNKLYEEFLSVGDIPEEQKVPAMKMVIKKLPEENTQFLKYMLRFFKDLIEHSAQNKMDSRNLSIVFSPILLGGELSQLFLTRWKIQASIIELLINSSDEIL